MFSDAWSRPIVANMIDTAAQDSAAVWRRCPFNCSASTGLSEAAKRFADKRSKIARNFLERSEFELQMMRGADQYNSYGMLVISVEPDFEENTPRFPDRGCGGVLPGVGQDGPHR